MLLISNPFVKAFLKREFLLSPLYNHVTEVCQIAFNTPILSKKNKPKPHPKLSTPQHAGLRRQFVSKSEGFAPQRTALTSLSHGELQLSTIPDQVPFNC